MSGTVNSYSDYLGCGVIKHEEIAHQSSDLMLRPGPFLRNPEHSFQEIHIYSYYFLNQFCQICY